MDWVWETTPLLLADAIKKEVPGMKKQQNSIPIIGLCSKSKATVL